MFIDCLSLLHKKTMEYDSISDDDFNKLYNYLYLKIDDTYKYYLRLQSKIEEKKFLSPGEFLLINIERRRPIRVTKEQIELYDCSDCVKKISK